MCAGTGDRTTTPSVIRELSALLESQTLSKVPTIVIVDDDDLNREAIKILIRALRYNVQAFGSAEEYLESGQVHNTSCLISDIQMPGMSGGDLQKRLIAGGNQIPIIFMSGLCIEVMRTCVIETGVSGFLNKPIDVECLIECLNRALKNFDSKAAEEGSM
jgi:FixJ family two-component response regulator